MVDISAGRGDTLSSNFPRNCHLLASEDASAARPSEPVNQETPDVPAAERASKNPPPHPQPVGGVHLACLNFDLRILNSYCWNLNGTVEVCSYNVPFKKLPGNLWILLALSWWVPGSLQVSLKHHLGDASLSL